jgi:hypothetical protein
MDDRTGPSILYTTKNNNNNLDEDIGNLDDVRNDNPQWEEDAIT